MGEIALQPSVQAALDELVAGGGEVGLQAAVMKDGVLVADAQSGVADPASGEPVSAGTLFFAGSTAKGVLSSLAHALVAAGSLDYDRRLAEVWPEFAANGKDGVTVRHVLMHQAGVPGLPADLTTEQFCDWHYMCRLVAAATWWAPGTAFGYHAQTFGFLLGETLQRATRACLVDLLQTVLSGPLGVADQLHFAVPASLLGRVARQVAPPGPPPPGPAPGSPLARAFPPGASPDAAFANRRDVLTAQIPSMGTMSARAAACVYAALLGHVPGIRLLSDEQLAAVAAVAYTGADRVMEMDNISWSLGYSPSRPSGAVSRPGSTFGMVGTNGSAAYADIDTGVAIALMRNRFSSDFTAITRLDAIVAETYPAARARIKERSMTTPSTELDTRFSEPPAQPTSWQGTLEAIKQAEIFWISTVRADGRPHVTPLVAVWLDDALHFSTGAGEQKALNLANNPRVALITGANDWQGGLDVVVEGEAIRVTDPEQLQRLAAAWAQKWDGRWRYSVDEEGFRHEVGTALVFAVRPAKVLAFAKGSFSQTRHRFSGR